MIHAHFKKHVLRFKVPAGTSRGILLQKPSWFICLSNSDNTNQRGVGECSIIPGLSIEEESDVELKLEQVCEDINGGAYNFSEAIPEFPSITFGLETAYLDYNSRASKVLFPSNFTDETEGIRINGLIWMGDIKAMHSQIEKKVSEGYRCIKLKIGALKINEELQVIRSIRKEFPASELEIRVDANGAFSYDEARSLLETLATLDIHSIEQPIAAHQEALMARLCKYTPVPIALDEELIGVSDFGEKKRLIEKIRPQFIILKPSLLGGFKASTEWLEIANELSVGWWVTSALESNIGLNAIAQWTYTLGSNLPQGLGTGSLYTNNISSPLEIFGEKLFYRRHKKWNYEFVY